MTTNQQSDFFDSSLFFAEELHVPTLAASHFYFGNSTAAGDNILKAVLSPAAADINEIIKFFQIGVSDCSKDIYDSCERFDTPQEQVELRHWF